MSLEEFLCFSEPLGSRQWPISHGRHRASYLKPSTNRTVFQSRPAILSKNTCCCTAALITSQTSLLTLPYSYLQEYPFDGKTCHFQGTGSIAKQCAKRATRIGIYWNYDQPELTSTRIYQNRPEASRTRCQAEASRMAVGLLSPGERAAQTIGACLVRSLGFQGKRG